MEDAELLGALALNRIFGFTPKYSHQIIQELGSCAAVFDLKPQQLRGLLGPSFNKEDAISPRALEDARSELLWLRSRGWDFLPIGSTDYPALLSECPDAPIGLYIRSDHSASEIFGPRRMISVVGTRDISFYGKECCEDIVRTISRAAPSTTIVSGLALGVDITAHMAALACGLPTVAVLPCGIDIVYPRRHSVAADKIASAPGSALVTDYPPGTQPQACAFLRRNRIIAGLSSSTILIESKCKGGGMMTARLAAGYSRDVFAVPGRIGDLRSQGCNALVAEKIAEPVVSISSLPALLRTGGSLPPDKRSLRQRVLERFRDLGDDKSSKLASVCELVSRSPGTDLNGISEATGLEYGETASLVMTLENEGILETDLLQRCCIHSNFV